MAQTVHPRVNGDLSAEVEAVGTDSPRWSQLSRANHLSSPVPRSTSEPVPRHSRSQPLFSKFIPRSLCPFTPLLSFLPGFRDLIRFRVQWRSRSRAVLLAVEARRGPPGWRGRGANSVLGPEESSGSLMFPVLPEPQARVPG